MKTVLSIVAVLFFSLSIVAQPNYNLNVYSVKAGQKANFYNNEANRLIKRGQFNEAVLNAANALKLADKKGQIAEAHERLNDSYDRAIQENLIRIETLKGNTETFNGDITVTELAEIVRIYKTMRNYNNVLRLVPPKSYRSVKKKDPGLHIEIENYKDDLDAAKKAFEQGKEMAAAMHYDKGRELSRNSDLESNKQAAREFKWADMYVKGFRDAKARYATAKDLGTTRMGITAMQSSSQASSYGDLGSMTSEYLVSDLMSGNKYEFFDIVSRDQLDLILKEQQLNLSGMMDESSTAAIGNLKGVNVLLVGKINTAAADRQSLQPMAKSYQAEVADGKEKYIDSEGKEKERTKYKTVYAVAQIFTKTAQASASGSFKILDVETGTILKAGTVSGNYDWKYEWAKYTGDKRALPGNVQSMVGRTEAQFPLNTVLVQNAVENLSKNLSNEVREYANQVGR
ncbi:MAG: hypothetical protein KDC79_16360 [Cyclobacteriaceae bacterium]|nr:hypothetical protein [Cyclobacteriaceae bacterium]